MQRQYTFIIDAISKGKTVMAYDRKAVPARMRRIKPDNFAGRVKLENGVLYIDGVSAQGWTLAVKP